MEGRSPQWIRARNCHITHLLRQQTRAGRLIVDPVGSPVATPSRITIVKLLVFGDEYAPSDESAGSQTDESTMMRY